MPHHSRAALREQAKITRELGETVWIQTNTNPTTSRATPLSIVLADAPVKTDITETAIYAVVEWHTDEADYDDAGRAHNIIAIVTASATYIKLLQGAYAVRFSNGTVLRKQNEILSQDRTSYAVLCQGVANIQE